MRVTLLIHDPFASSFTLKEALIAKGFSVEAPAQPFWDAAISKDGRHAGYIRSRMGGDMAVEFISPDLASHFLQGLT